MVPFKNENILPFTPQEKIALVQPRGPITRYSGAWSWQGKKKKPFPSWLGAQKLTTNLLVAQEPFKLLETPAAAIEGFNVS